MNESNIKEVYVTSDGKEFTDYKKAREHAKFIELSQKAPDVIKCNLDEFLANKSKLKAGVFKRDAARLEKAWNRWQKAIPKSKNAVNKLVAGRASSTSENIFQEIYDALYELEKTVCQCASHQIQFNMAKEYIPKLNAALKGGPGFYSKDLIMAAPGYISEW